MAHAIWKGSISFGLVNVPVALRPAESRKELEFSLLDKRNMSPIGYRKVNKVSGEEVPKDAVVKGYRLDDGNVVLVTDEDLKRANPERTQRIDILGFVDLGEIDPSYFDRPYYLEPIAKNEKGYALLREALEKTGKVGIASVVIRTRQYLAAVVARGRVMILELLRFAHELRAPEGLDLPGTNLKALGITPREVEMATRLVEEMGEKWEPEKYKDEYTEEVLAFIRKKAKAGGKEMPEEPVPKKKEKPVLDMMSLLKQSLEARGGARKKAPAKHRRKTA